MQNYQRIYGICHDSLPLYRKVIAYQGTGNIMKLVFMSEVTQYDLFINVIQIVCHENNALMINLKCLEGLLS